MVDTRHGPAWLRRQVLPLGPRPGHPPVPDHAYLDTETTGLRGGTGTHVFAAAVCTPCEDGMAVSQLFLAEPAAEAGFLAALEGLLKSAPALATYNGSRFDLPLLRTRWVMARMPGDLPHPRHLDLLILTRALLRQRLESCALRAVEEKILGFERDGDLPGAMVPEAYLGYLRLGWSPTLEAALEHNRQDVVSLYHLHARLLLRLSGEEPLMEAADWLALGRYLTRQRRRADGWRALRRAAGLADGPAAAVACLLLARELGRRKRFEVAERVLHAVHQRLPGEVILAVARARLLERRLRQPQAAREVVAQALGRVAGCSPWREDLEHRLNRLDSRLARARRRLPAGAGPRPSWLLAEPGAEEHSAERLRPGRNGRLLDCG